MSSSVSQLQAALLVAETTVSALRAQLALAEAAQTPQAAPELPQAAPEPVAAAPVQVKKAPTQWRKSNAIVLCSEEEVSSINHRIDSGELYSRTKCVRTWGEGTMFHPRTEMPARIIALLARAPERRLSFQALIVDLKLGLDLKNTLQMYLREMEKQGLITTA